jgi:hypothetical protein
LAAGTLRPLEYQLLDGEGWDKVIEAAEMLDSGKFSQKLAVTVHKE